MEIILISNSVDFKGKGESFGNQKDQNIGDLLV